MLVVGSGRETANNDDGGAGAWQRVVSEMLDLEVELDLDLVQSATVPPRQEAIDAARWVTFLAGHPELTDGRDPVLDKYFNH